MAASTLAFTYTELRRWIGREIGINRTASSWDTIPALDGNDCLKRGLHGYYWPKLPEGTHVWSWLKPKLANLELHGPYSTGTVAVSSGVVTLTSGTWPTWAAQGDIYVDGYWATVNTRDSNTQITLDDTSITGISAGETYELIHREYDLADDFGGIVEPFTFRPDQQTWTTIQTVNEAMIRSHDHYPAVRSFPSLAAIVSTVPTSAQESKQRALFDPPPDGTYSLWYRYSVVPPNLDGSTYVYAHGGAQYMDALLASCVDVALQTLWNDSSRHDDYLEKMRAAIKLDKQLNKADTLGFGSHSSGYDRGHYTNLTDHRRQSTMAVPSL